MKTKSVVLNGMAILLFMVSCQSQQNEEATAIKEPEAVSQTDLEAEKEKLKAICILETQLFLEGKSNQHLYWESPKTQVIQKATFSEESYWALGGEVKTKGSLSYLESNPDFVMEILDRTDYVIEVTDDMAYVTYRQHLNWQDNPTAEKLTGYSHEVRVFIKENDEWKIALATTIY